MKILCNKLVLKYYIINIAAQKMYTIKSLF